jgi:hypothetical protein
LKELGYELADNGGLGKYGGRNIYSQRNIVKIHKGKAGSVMALPLLCIFQAAIVDF